MKTLLSILLASAATTPAFAQTQSTAPAAATTEQIATLQAQIQALQTQVNQLQSAQAATAAQAAAPTPDLKPKTDVPAWIHDTRISGKAYANISNIDHESDGADLGDSGTQTELKRFYLGVDHQFNDIFSANLTTDFRYNSNGTSNDVLVYVKKAYVQARFAPEFFVRVGAADLPWVGFSESVYGYRFVENSLIDRTKYGTSSDWGVHVGGSLAGGRISYAASAINGAGYKTLSRSSNTIDLEGRISASPIKNITLGIGGYTGKLGKSSEVNQTQHRATRWNALAAYTDKRIRAGVEYFQAKNWNNVTTLATDKSDGWSAFGSFAFTPQLAIFGRYDRVRPNRDTNPDLKESYFNVGLNFKPVKEIDLALVYKRDRARNGFIRTSNGTIGGIDRGTYDEIGIFSQFAF
ncbi:MAG TPA: FlxA-like family protein [Sphingomicrobium sp.]|jgi:type II secretory pathway pseudopilin PulG|nr:FlxA-like family protein [Sphingomicrobium sp.]